MARPKGALMTRDTVVIGQGTRVPPHVSVAAEASSIDGIIATTSYLAKLARQAGSHIDRKAKKESKKSILGTNVFIGHGGSLVWRELQEFIEKRVKLPTDEFNRVPVAGVTNISRLSEMLEAAAIAFLVMTGEDEQQDGKLHARLNVVHEAGLFQGRLGFGRAIIILEEGCESFSNIEGLGQIRFPKGNMKAAFEEVRRVLEREDLID
jgi:predicted nucleotide-binding protein